MSCRRYCELNEEQKAKLRKKSSEWSKANRSKVRVWKAKWIAANPDKVHAHTIATYARNVEMRRAKTAAWKRENPDKVAIQTAKRRAKKRGAAGELSADIVQKLRALQKNKCAACRTMLRKYHLDHVVSLAVGGMHEDSNMQLLCPSCNCSKRHRDPISFMQSRGFLL